MDSCTSLFMDKLAKTVDMIFGSCVFKRNHDDDESISDCLKGDDEYRKEELKQLVGIFAEAAQSYIPCTIIESNTKRSAMYKLDNMLNTLTIKMGDSLKDIQLAHVEGVYSLDDLSDDIKYDFILNNKTIKQLTMSEKDRFVLIEHMSNSDIVHTILLVEKLGNNDPFITVMRILKMYSNYNST